MDAEVDVYMSIQMASMKRGRERLKGVVNDAERRKRRENEGERRRGKDRRRGDEMR